MGSDRHSLSFLQSNAVTDPTTAQPPEADTDDPRDTARVVATLHHGHSDQEIDTTDDDAGRLPLRWVLHPVYAVTLLCAGLVAWFSYRTGEWHPIASLTGWSILAAWYWLYGLSYRYRRRWMKLFATFMASITAASLTLVSALRFRSMEIPVDGFLEPRPAQPLLLLVAILTTLSLAAIIAHLVYLGRPRRRPSSSSDSSS